MLPPVKIKILYEELMYKIGKESLKIKPLYSQVSKKTKADIKRLVMELSDESEIIKRAVNWNEKYNSKIPKEDEIIKYFKENTDKNKYEKLQKIKKSQTKYIVWIINKTANEKIKNIDEYIQYASKVQ